MNRPSMLTPRGIDISSEQLAQQAHPYLQEAVTNRMIFRWCLLCRNDR
jgi:hypothetical protein